MTIRDEKDAKVLAAIRACSGKVTFTDISSHSHVRGRDLDKHLQSMRRRLLIEFFGGKIGWAIK